MNTAKSILVFNNYCFGKMIMRSKYNFDKILFVKLTLDQKRIGKERFKVIGQKL